MTQRADDDLERTELLATRSPGVVATAGEAQALPPGARIGRYRIEALLGRGGMGEVYRAEQLEPVRRTVALKLLRAQKLDARHLAYFEVERQLLAQMQHPAIARIYDADTTPDGFPYFAMEFIAGSPVTRHCDEHRLPLRERLALFVRICEGVQHAHQKGVVHRDLKPGNLLVESVDGRALRSEYEPEGSTVPAASPLVASAREASLKWTFNAAVKDGKPVEAWVAVPVRFEPGKPAGGA